MRRAVDVWRERTQFVTILALTLLLFSFVFGGTLFVVLGSLAAVAGFAALACFKRWRDALTAEQGPIS